MTSFMMFTEYLKLLYKNKEDEFCKYYTSKQLEQSIFIFSWIYILWYKALDFLKCTVFTYKLEK